MFVAAYSPLDSPDLNPDERKRIQEILIWFQKNLPTPPKRLSTGRAVFWFKSSADESIRQVWELVHALRQHGYYVEVQKCRRLANICFDDSFQIAAYPSKLDGRITVQ